MRARLLAEGDGFLQRGEVAFGDAKVPKFLLQVFDETSLHRHGRVNGFLGNGKTALCNFSVPFVCFAQNLAVAHAIRRGVTKQGERPPGVGMFRQPAAQGEFAGLKFEPVVFLEAFVNLEFAAFGVIEETGANHHQARVIFLDQDLVQDGSRPDLRAGDAEVVTGDVFPAGGFIGARKGDWVHLAERLRTAEDKTIRRAVLPDEFIKDVELQLQLGVIGPVSLVRDSGLHERCARKHFADDAGQHKQNRPVQQRGVTRATDLQGNSLIEF